jgi:hypothetical protein
MSRISADQATYVLGRHAEERARLVLHEYIKWETFALHPKGDQLAKFAARCIQHWWARGGYPNVAQRLSQLLEVRGFRLLHSSSLMACSPSDYAKAQWLIDFLSNYPAQQHASLWVTPAIVGMVWERL